MGLGEIGLPESGNLSLDLLLLGSELLLKSLDLNLLCSKIMKLLKSLLTPLKTIEDWIKVGRVVFELLFDVLDKVLRLLVLDCETKLQK